MIEKDLLTWYESVKRDLPWRENHDFYSVWISEIMLQQTRVNQMLVYFKRFMKAFPTLQSLALSFEDQVLKNWEGLGYYSRARNLHYTAQYILQELENKPPENFEELKKLKGIGDYTAAAIASICFKEPIISVDGNVFRVLARQYGIRENIAIPKTRKIFFDLGNKIISQQYPGDYNQALMELGATVCTPKNPLCIECPVQKTCYAYQHQMTSELPVNEKQLKIKERYLNYLIINNTFLLKKREHQDIWKNLYELPLIESDKLIDQINKWNEINVVDSYIRYDIEHKLTHRLLHVRFWNIEISEIDFLLLKDQYITYSIEDLADIKEALPKPIVLLINKLSQRVFEF